MKKLILLILIFSTILFAFSCDNNEPVDENSNEEVENTCEIEETSTENQENAYYSTVFEKHRLTSSIFENMSKIVYTEYQEFVDEITTNNIELKDNFNKDIFNNNYLLLVRTEVYSGGHIVYGLRDFKYESNNKMSIVVDIRFPAYDETVTDAYEYFYHIVVIPKSLFPDDVSKIPNEIEVIRNKVENDKTTTEGSSTVAVSKPLTRADKVKFNFAQNESVIMKTNANGYDYVAYGYNDATYIISVEYTDSEENQKAIIASMTDAIRYYGYNFYPEPEEDSWVARLSTPILEKEDGRLTLYFCCFADYSTVQEKLLDELSKIDCVSKITVKNLVFSHSEVVTSYKYERFKSTQSAVASCKGEIFTSYSEFQAYHINLGISEDIFEENYVILRGIAKESAEFDSYYYNAVCENGTAYITYVEDNVGMSTGETVYYIDVIKIPKNYFKNASGLTTESEVKIIEMRLDFESINDWVYANPGIGSYGWIEK